MNLKSATAVLALFLVGLFAAGIFYFSASNQTTLEREFAELSRQNLSDAAELKDIYAVNLMSGTFRDSSAAINKLPSDKLAEKVLFKLALPVVPAAADAFKVELVKNQKVVFTQANQQFYNNPNGQELRFFLPAKLLEKGAYQIKVSGETAKNSGFIYDFAVE